MKKTTNWHIKQNTTNPYRHWILRIVIYVLATIAIKLLLWWHTDYALVPVGQYMFYMYCHCSYIKTLKCCINDEPTRYRLKHSRKQFYIVFSIIIALAPFFVEPITIYSLIALVVIFLCAFKLGCQLGIEEKFAWIKNKEKLEYLKKP